MKGVILRNKKGAVLHKEFVKILLRSPVRGVKFSKDKISLTFFGHRISDKIKIKNKLKTLKFII